MAKFNIHDSKIDQLNDGGNNYKLTTGAGDNLVSEAGNVVQTEGRDNKVLVDQPKKSVWSMLWTKIKGLWKMIVSAKPAA